MYSGPMAKLSLKGMLARILNLAYFKDEAATVAIPHLLVPSKGKLLLVTGDNAGGKSFFRRLVHAVTREQGTECIHISMESRTGGMYGPARAMVYGDESWESTGSLSVSTVLNGISTCKSRTTPHVMFWDEPDLGLSDSWAAGVGQKIAEFAKAAGDNTRAVILVTHSKALVRELLPAFPWYLHLGAEPEAAPPTVKAWLDAPIVPRNPEELARYSHSRFKKIQAILDHKKK